jgi:apolipoprotein N-acyltransferase
MMLRSEFFDTCFRGPTSEDLGKITLHYGTLEAQVRLLDTKTPYAKFGEFMPLALILVGFMLWKKRYLRD